MSLQPVLDYLTALEQNNDRDWYHAFLLYTSRCV